MQEICQNWSLGAHLIRLVCQLGVHMKDLEVLSLKNLQPSNLIFHPGHSRQAIGITRKVLGPGVKVQQEGTCLAYC